MIDFEKEEFESMKELLNQYRKEYFDATYKRGLFANMPTFERLSAACNLRDHITALENDIRKYEKKEVLA